MQFPGYWVSVESNKATLLRTTFDETDLDPATNWKQAWQNQDAATTVKGFVELKAALLFAVEAIAYATGHVLSEAQIEQAIKFEPEWVEDRCEVQSLWP